MVPGRETTGRIEEGTYHYTPACDDDEIICEGSDVEETIEQTRAKRMRYEDHAAKISQGRIPVILSARLKGPFDRNSGWHNPWAYKTRRQAQHSNEKSRRPRQGKTTKTVAGQTFGVSALGSFQGQVESVVHSKADANDAVAGVYCSGTGPVQNHAWLKVANVSTQDRWEGPPTTSPTPFPKAPPIRKSRIEPPIPTMASSELLRRLSLLPEVSHCTPSVRLLVMENVAGVQPEETGTVQSITTFNRQRLDQMHDDDLQNLKRKSSQQNLRESVEESSDCLPNAGVQWDSSQLPVTLKSTSVRKNPHYPLSERGLNAFHEYKHEHAAVTSTGAVKHSLSHSPFEFAFQRAESSDELSFVTEVAPSCRDLEKFQFRKKRRIAVHEDAHVELRAKSPEALRNNAHPRLNTIAKPIMAEELAKISSLHMQRHDMQVSPKQTSSTDDNPPNEESNDGWNTTLGGEAYMRDCIAYQGSPTVNKLKRVTTSSSSLHSTLPNADNDEDGVSILAESDPLVYHTAEVGFQAVDTRSRLDVTMQASPLQNGARSSVEQTPMADQISCPSPAKGGQKSATMSMCQISKQSPDTVRKGRAISQNNVQILQLPIASSPLHSGIAPAISTRRTDTSIAQSTSTDTPAQANAGQQAESFVEDAVDQNDMSTQSANTTPCRTLQCQNSPSKADAPRQPPPFDEALIQQESSSMRKTAGLSVKTLNVLLSQTGRQNSLQSQRLQAEQNRTPPYIEIGSVSAVRPQEDSEIHESRLEHTTPITATRSFSKDVLPGTTNSPFDIGAFYKSTPEFQRNNDKDVTISSYRTVEAINQPLSKNQTVSAVPPMMYLATSQSVKCQSTETSSTVKAVSNATSESFAGGSILGCCSTLAIGTEDDGTDKEQSSCVYSNQVEQRQGKESIPSMLSQELADELHMDKSNFSVRLESAQEQSTESNRPEVPSPDIQTKPRTQQTQSQSPWKSEDLDLATSHLPRSAQGSTATTTNMLEENNMTRFDHQAQPGWQHFEPIIVRNAEISKPLLNVATPNRLSMADPISTMKKTSNIALTQDENPWVSTLKQSVSRRPNKRVSFSIAHDNENDRSPYLTKTETFLPSRESPPHMPETVEDISTFSTKRSISLLKGATPGIIAPKPFKRILPDKRASQFNSSPAGVEAMAEAFITADQKVIVPETGPPAPSFAPQSPSPRYGSPWNEDTRESSMFEVTAAGVGDDIISTHPHLAGFDLDAALADANDFLEDWSVEAELRRSQPSTIARNAQKRRLLFGIQ